MGGSMTRYTMDMDEKFEQTLRELAQGSSTAEVIRNAVATYKYLKSRVPGTGGPNHVSISDNDGVVRQVVILP